MNDQDSEKRRGEYIRNLVKRLANKSFMQSLRSALQAGREGLEYLANQDDQDYNDRFRALYDADSKMLKSRGKAIFEAKVINHLPKPPLIDGDELATIAKAHFPGVNLEHGLKPAVRSFAAATVAILNEQDYDYDLVPLGEWDLIGVSGVADNYYRCLVNPHPLWHSDSGLCVLLVVQHRYPETVLAFAQLTDQSSAADKVREVLVRFLPVIVEAMYDVFGHRSMTITDEMLLELFDALDNNDSEVPDSTKQSLPADLTWEEIHALVLPEDRRRFIGFCLDALFECGVFRDNSTMGRRVLTALMLLREGHRQEEPAIRTVLYCSALEALLSQGSTEVTDQLARRVAAILEPDGLQRPDAIERMKEIYKRRSKAIHGERLEGTERLASQVFLINAAVLHAIEQWLRFQHSMTDSATEDAFLKQVKVAEQSGQRMVGVPEDHARVLRFDPKQF